MTYPLHCTQNKLEDPPTQPRKFEWMKNLHGVLHENLKKWIRVRNETFQFIISSKIEGYFPSIWIAFFQMIELQVMR